MSDTLKSELKQMGAEMSVNQYVPEQWHWLDATEGEDFTCGRRGMWGNAAGGKAIKTFAVGGAEVYHDITAEGGKGTRADVHRGQAGAEDHVGQVPPTADGAVADQVGQVA